MIPRMSKEEFLESVMSQIKDYLPAEFQNAEVRYEKVLKEGDQIWTGLIVRIPEDQSYPRIYVDSDYLDYVAGRDMGDILRDLASQRLQYAAPPDLTQEVKDLMKDEAAVKERISYRMVNTENNREILQGRPHTDMGEVSMVYSVEMNSGARIPITNKLQEQMLLSTEELHALAEKNSPELLPVKIQSMGEALGFPGNHPEDMLVVTNAELQDGAAAIFYPGVAETIRDRLEGDFLILPSSIHEVLVIPEQNNRDLEGLEAMVRSINKMGVLPQDKLADHVLKLSRDGRSLVPAERVQPVKNVHRSQEAR